MWGLNVQVVSIVSLCFSRCQEEDVGSGKDYMTTCLTWVAHFHLSFSWNQTENIYCILIHMQQLAMEGGLAWEAPINRFMQSESKSCRALWPVSVSQGSYHQESGCTVPFFIIWTKRIFTESKALECIYLFVFDFRVRFAAQQRKDRLAFTSVYFSFSLSLKPLG